MAPGGLGFWPLPSIGGELEWVLGAARVGTAAALGGLMLLLFLLAAQTPEALDLLDQWDRADPAQAALIEAALSEGPDRQQELLWELSTLPAPLSRRRSIELQLRYREAWDRWGDEAGRARSFELGLRFDVAALWPAPDPEPAPPPLPERARWSRCEWILRPFHTPIGRAYARAAFEALACAEVGP